MLYKRAVFHKNMGSSSKFLANLDAAVDAGYPKAIYELGNIYQHGTFGFEKCADTAFKLYLRVEQDINQGIRCLRKSAKQEYAPACYLLAECYLKGEAVKKNPRKAFHLLKRACWHSYELAYYRYAMCLLDGIGCERNEERGLMYLDDAVEIQML